MKLLGNFLRLLAVGVWCLGGLVAHAASAPGPTSAETLKFSSPQDLPRNQNLPDPRVTGDGNERVSPASWSRRREEMKRVVEYYFCGSRPPAPTLTSRVVTSRTIGGVDYQLWRLTLDNDAKRTMEIATFVPSTRTQPRPTLIFLSPTGTPGAPIPSPLPAKFQASTPEEFIAAHSASWERGYAVVTYYFQQGAIDHPENKKEGFFPAYPGYDWGTLAVWSWTVSRCVDFLQTQPWADHERVGIVGHSRLGKAVLLAGALDERIALVAAAGSGFGGTGAMRVSGKLRGGKEGLEEATQRFPYWFGPHLAEFAGSVDRLPFDANWIMSLVAPRALLDCEAFDDPYCNGAAAVAAYRATVKIYQFLAVPERIGLHFRDGGHALTDDDWGTILDFADHQFLGLPAQHDFQAWPDPARLH